MSAPFFKFGMFGDDTSLVVAFIIGIGFGFFLERAGFGSARKLVSQFYLNDMAVFKVMFTAIVTAMLGVTYLGWMGILDLSLVYLVPDLSGAPDRRRAGAGLRLRHRRILPRDVGGCVGHGQARRHGVRARRVRRTVPLRRSLPAREGVLRSHAHGRTDHSAAVRPAYGLVVFAVVLMAVGGFYGASLLEKKFAAAKE